MCILVVATYRLCRVDCRDGYTFAPTCANLENSATAGLWIGQTKLFPVPPPPTHTHTQRLAVTWCHIFNCTALLFSNAMHRNALQHTESQTPHSTSASNMMSSEKSSMHCNTVQRAASHCNTLQYTATRCNTLQYTQRPWVTWYHCNNIATTFQHHIQSLLVTGCQSKGALCTATRCNTLQHAATHCNTLQHTASVL